MSGARNSKAGVAAAASGLSTAARLAAVARVVVSVMERGVSLDDALQAAIEDLGDQRDRAAVQALAYGTLRWVPRIELWVEMLLERPGQLRQPEVRALIMVALHQLAFSSHPAHAIVNEAVKSTRLLRQPRTSGLVNAVLRRFLRESESIKARALERPIGRFAHPQWLIGMLRSDWPGDFEALLDANNVQPPMWLRVNARRTTVTAYRRALQAGGMATRASEYATQALELEQPVDVEALPGFATGEVSVQDAGAQLAAPLLDAGAGMRVLDACAAPGGKTAHILERTPELRELVALDREETRLAAVRANLMRLGLSARVLQGDARRPADWWDERPFERILVDASCSSTGVIRRHPDIKVLRRPNDIEALAREQLGLLTALWPLLAPQGRLVYSTCSVLRAENEQVVAAFLAMQPHVSDVTLAGWPRALGHRTNGPPGVQVLPGEAGMDGFYYACLQKP